jgi:thiosulfate dehydrogenase [quinone] large subunit
MMSQSLTYLGGHLLLRWFLGLLMVMAFVGKMRGEKGEYALWHYYDWAERTQMEFARETFLPSGVLYLYCHSLGWMELVLGVMLLLGVRPRLSLLLLGLVFLSLGFGMMLMRQHDVVANIGVYVGLTVGCLLLHQRSRLDLWSD